MRVLVLGATGRLGRMLRQRWHAVQPLGVDHVVWQARGQVDGPDWLSCDLLQDQAGLTKAMAASDVVVDLTGVVPGPGRDMSDNLALAKASLTAQQQAGRGAHLILASSSAVYGRHAAPCREDSAASPPLSPYGAAKQAVEDLAAQTGSPVTCLRIGNVAGADALFAPASPRDGPVILDQFPDGRSPRRSYLGPAGFGDLMGQLVRAVGTTQMPALLNFAAPGAVEMADLLRAAGLDWITQSAPDTALPSLTLETTRLQSLISVPCDLGDPARIVAEWRAYQSAEGAA